MTNTPIFIINRNNLDRGLRQQVEWLRAAGMTHITIVDNASTYPPLLDWYNRCGLRVIRKDRNYGPWVFWETGMHHQQQARYIVSDADVVPDADCPTDLVEKMSQVFDRYSPRCLKVGPGLRIDNLPACYMERQKVIDHERQYSDESCRMPEGDAFEAHLDTTFAMYAPHSAFPPFQNHFRLASPYVFEHRPWYEDSMAPNAERQFYASHVENNWSHWGSTLYNDNHIMQGLWIGKSLSEMEQLSIRSFLANGHTYHLYLYGTCEGVPAGTTIMDASEIMLESTIKNYVSLQAFSDEFRYRLMQRRARWWVDLDTVCLRPFDFTEDYVFSCERLQSGQTLVDSSPLKAPRDSEFLREAIRECEAQDTRHPAGKFDGWIALGPELVDRLTKRLGLYVRPPETFNPVLCWQVKDLIDPGAVIDLSHSYAVHMWHSQWEWQGMNQKKPYPFNCLYEQLKMRYPAPRTAQKKAAHAKAAHAKVGYCAKHVRLGCMECTMEGS